MLHKTNKHPFLAPLLAVFCLVAFVASHAEIEPSRLQAVTSDLQSRIDAGRLSGAVVMVAQDGEILMQEALGYQNVEEQVPMRTDTIFRIFSMTKPITGVALMMLHDEGKFELDDPLAQHLPELSGLEVLVATNEDGTWETEPVDHPPTVRELMSHTGGFLYTPPLSQGPIAEAYAQAGIMDLAGHTLDESMPALADIPLAYQPGTQWVYSISVDIQGWLVERLSGMPFDAFLQQRLFDPLGMVDTGFYVQADKAARLARQYAPAEEGELRRTDDGSFLQPPKFLSGGGGLTSTAGDYMKFALMLLNEGQYEGQRLLSEEAVELMRSNQLPEAVADIGRLYQGNVFGLDFAIVQDPDANQGAPVGTHWWWGIAGSWFWIDPVEDIIFIGMIQNGDIFYSLQTHAASRSAIYQ